MPAMKEDHGALVRHEDRETMTTLLGLPRLTYPDLVIAPDGEGAPYLYRWHMMPYIPGANVMLHLQVASDPQRPLHDHPWDNQSVILAGRYLELLQSCPPFGVTENVVRRKGDVITRAAREAHRLILPDDEPYALTIFSTGPRIQEWGFWYGADKHPWARHVQTENGVSIHVNRNC